MGDDLFLSEWRRGSSEWGGVAVKEEGMEGEGEKGNWLLYKINENGF